MDHPELEQLPEELRDEVEKYLASDPCAKLLGIKTSGSRYSVYTETLNILSSFWLDKSIPSLGVVRDRMLAGDVDVFLKHSRWFKGRNQTGD